MKKLRMTVDCLMVLLLPLLMAYSLIGELYHEIIGITMGVLFVTHLALNRKWFSSLFRGRYDARRIVTTLVDFLLIICVLTSMVSGIILSKHLFRFLGIKGLSYIMRSLHLLAAYWGLVLMSFHAGTHGSMLLSKIGKKPVRYTVSAILLLAAGYGVYAFIKRSIADFLFGKVMFVFFDTTEPFILRYLDYIAIIILFMTIGFFVTKLLSLKRREIA